MIELAAEELKLEFSYSELLAVLFSVGQAGGVSGTMGLYNILRKLSLAASLLGVVGFHCSAEFVKTGICCNWLKDTGCAV